MVVLDSSVLVVVPSGDWVTVFSFDLTVPSLLSLVLLVLETSRSHPTSNGNAKAAIATQITAIRFIIMFFMEILFSFARATMLCDGRLRTISAKSSPSKALQVVRY